MHANFILTPSFQFCIKANCSKQLHPSRMRADEDCLRRRRSTRVSCVAMGLKSISCNHAWPGDSTLHLNLHANSIDTLQGLQRLTALQTLNISSNCLTDLQGLFSLPHLLHLNLASNQLRNMQGLGSIPSLTKLNVAHNLLTSLVGLEALKVGMTPSTQEF